MKTSKAQIDAIFETETDQGAVLEKLYRIAFPDWDEIG